MGQLKPKRKLSQRDLRRLASAGVTVLRYEPDGERAEIKQLTPEPNERRRSLTRRLDQDTDDMPASEEATSLDDRAGRELDRLITKRHDLRDGEAMLEPSYAASVRRYNARREEEHRSEWGNFHEKMSRLHACLSEEHAQKAELLKGE